MISIFRQKSPANVALLFIFGLLLKLPLFLFPQPIIAGASDGRLFRWLVSLLPQDSAILYSSLAYLLLFTQALMLNHLLNQYRMTARPGFLAAMAYMLITSLFAAWNFLSAPLLANTFIIWMLIELFRLYNSSRARASIFNIGLMAGIASYIFFPSVAFLICVLLGLMILKPFRLNEMVLLLLGCLTPYYFHAAWLFLYSDLTYANFVPLFYLEVPEFQSSIWLAAGIVLLTLPFLIGGYYVQANLGKMLIQVRKNWSILLIYLLLAFGIPFINTGQSFHTWVLLAVPFAAFHACAYFYPAKRWLPLTLFFITIGYILYQQYGTLTWQ